MASYNTIPAAAEDSLLAPKKNNKNWHDYDPSCIHLACDQKNIIWNDYTWYCND